MPNQAYKFRVDYNGKQYWASEVTIIAHEENGIEVNIDQLTLDETNNPNPTRFDGFPPLYRKEAVKVATAGSLVGLLAQTQANLGDSNPGIVYYYINDHLGTPQLMADHEGLVVWQADYEPFGAATVDPDSSTINQHRFPGQYADEETQLHYNYHRYYDPRSGRYIMADPIGQEGGINVYLYVENNPLNGIDQFGLEAWLKCKRCGSKGPLFCNVIEDGVDTGDIVTKYGRNNVSITKGDIYGTNGPLPPGSYKICNDYSPKFERILPSPTNTRTPGVVRTPKGTMRAGVRVHKGMFSAGCLTTGNDPTGGYNEERIRNMVYRHDWSPSGCITLTIEEISCRCCQ